MLNKKSLNILDIKNNQNLKQYVDFLLEYNTKINLVGKSTIDDIWNRHILDSLQILNLIDNQDIKIADLGSGAGLPGIPLSISGIKEIHLFEKSIRKCEFLELAKKFSNNKIIVRNENLNEVNDNSFDIIISRALADLNKLLNFSQNLVKENSKLIFLKGKKYQEEIEEAKKIWDFEYKLSNSITSNEGRVIEIFNFKKIK